MSGQKKEKEKNPFGLYMKFCIYGVSTWGIYTGK